MKHFLTSIVLFVGLLTLGCGNDDSASTTQANKTKSDATASQNNTRVLPAFLWEITSKTAKPSYLFGTIHLGVTAEKELPKIVFDKIKTADTFVMEMDLESIDQTALVKKTMLTEYSLKNKLTSKQWKSLTTLMGPQVPEAALEKIQPWFLTMALSAQMIPQTSSMDIVLLKTAQDTKKTLSYLETWQTQIDALIQSATLKDLQELLDDPSKTKKELERLLTQYRSGNLRNITDILLDSKQWKNNPKSMDIMLIDRNKAWLPKIITHLDKGNAFIAVGLGHYVGKDGLLELLKDKGYRIRRLTQ